MATPTKTPTFDPVGQCPFLLIGIVPNPRKEQIRTSISKPITNDKPLQYRGTIIKISLDRHGKYYGFISKLPNDIFFHERDNPGLRFSTLYAHDVLYYFKKDKVTYTEKAVNMQPL